MPREDGPSASRDVVTTATRLWSAASRVGLALAEVWCYLHGAIGVTVDDSELDLYVDVLCWEGTADPELES
ncbi:MAG TPA: hypothetical protein VKS22_00570 [Candidatus Binataceae bacterium]|nr:hypothetical protein [Candidatus Binataceae bacterium]